MAKTVVTRPYELLVRWREGKISGAHVCFEDAIFEDGKETGTIPSHAMAVDIGSGKGFPLADILAQVNIDVLVSRDVALAEKRAAEGAAAEANKERAAAIAERDESNAEAAALKNSLINMDEAYKALQAKLDAIPVNAA